MLTLTAAILAKIEAHGVGSYPEEGCGLLLGHMRAGENVVTDILPVANKWPVDAEKFERFRIDAADMMKAEMKAAGAGVDVIGVFHSHPDCPPVASPRDLAWATWPGYSYLITGIYEGQPHASRSWQLQADRTGFAEESVQTTDGTPADRL